MPNRLAQSASPYLLQHKDNPVDWYEWGPEALDRARAEDKPILLSVGYSACHWCHVMERESFEDEATAAVMNEHFVNIKVDREERPDLDSIYMTAVQTFTGGRGGWPMTVFLLPDGRPFFGGTYFPPEPRHGMPSFRQVMDHVVRLLRDQRRQVEHMTGEVVGRIKAWEKLPAPAPELSTRWLDAVAEAAARDFDAEEGGFGQAPKFPPHGTLGALIAHYTRTSDDRSLAMVTTTLDAMAQGAMYDHLGGGFARYSVDDRWAVPHFEKMLYDNGQLLPVYLDGYLLTGRSLWLRVVRDSLEWMEREMSAPEGGFYASMDADSEGEEGRFFVWTPEQLVDVLGEDDGRRAAPLLGIVDGGTFEHGTSVLRMETPLEELADGEWLRESVFPRLFAARAERVPPGTDTKIVTAWNALAITAFARAGAALGEARWVERARRAADFLLTTATVDGRLLRTWKDGVRGPTGYADDHAFFVVALVDLWEATGELRWLRAARTVADAMLALFWDADDGGLFYTGADAEALVARTKNLTGGALPSANGMAALGLLRLGILTDNEEYRAKAEDIARRYQLLLDQAARALGPEAIVGDWLAGGGTEVGIVGSGDGLSALVKEVHGKPRPFSVLAVLPPDPDEGALTLLPWMRHRVPEGEASAWVCQGHACLAPVQTAAGLRNQLDGLTEKDAPPDTAGRVRVPALPTDPFRWVGGEPVSIEELAGHVVVLDFWALCCVNCHHVLPELAAIEERFADRPVRVIGVHSAKFPHEQERAAIELAHARHGIGHPVVSDPDRALWSAFAVKAWPTIVVLDADGREAWRQSGEVERATLARVVERLLGEAERAGTLADRAGGNRDADADGGGTRGDAGTEIVRGQAVALRFPSKVHVQPGLVAQARGADPLTDAAGALWVADTAHHRILECAFEVGADGWPTAARVVRAFGGGAGFADGAPGEARFREPRGMSLHDGVLWVADTGNHALRAIDVATGQVTTKAGTGRKGRGGRGDPTQPLGLDLRSPWAVEATDGVVFVAMAGTHQIWVYLPDRGHMGPMIGTGAEDHVDGVAQESALAQPSGMALFGAQLFWADAETSSIRLSDVERGQVMTVVGRGLFDFGDVDGPGDEARLQHPQGVTVAAGGLWVADTYNHKIKSIDLNGGMTTTVAGGDPAELREPDGLDALGSFLVVADTGNHRLRVLDRTTGELRDLPVVG